MVRYHLTWVQRHPEWARYLLQSREADFVAATKPELRQLNTEMLRQFSIWIEPFVLAGKVVRLPEELYGAILIGPCQHYARAWLSGRAETELESAVDVLADAAWQALTRESGG